MSTVRIGLLGLGHVGGAVAEALQRNADLFARRTGTVPVLSRIAVRHLNKPRRVQVDPGLLTTDAGAVVTDPDIDVVIEAIGGVEPAGAFVTRALQSGKSVVTANKQLVCARGTELVAAAAQYGRSLLYEASVGAALPIVRVVKESLAGDRISAFTAVLNGTANYILSKMEEGVDIAAALAEAQALGLAEQDPDDDTSGRDAAAKCAIVASLAFEAQILPQQIPYRGIAALSGEEVSRARASGHAVRLLAAARVNDGRIEAGVFPARLPAQHPLAQLRGPENGMLIWSELAGQLFIRGYGAGGVPTASAILGDLASIVGGRRAEPATSHRPVTALAPGDLPDLLMPVHVEAEA